MPATPIMFSTVTGLFLAALGVAFSVSGLSSWGLAVVGSGIVALALVSWLRQLQQERPALIRIQREGSFDQANLR